MQRNFWVKNGILGESGHAKVKIGGFRGNEHAKGLLG